MSADSEVDVNTIPSAMRNRDQWVGWSYQSRSDTKPAKIPLNPQNANRADPTDPDTWGSYSEVRASLDVDGVGFVFTDEDPYVGIDLDDCVDEDGTIDRWAQAIVDQLDSYTEYSPSGTGLHIISRGDIPGAKDRGDDIEMYDEERC